MYPDALDDATRDRTLEFLASSTEFGAYLNDGTATIENVAPWTSDNSERSYGVAVVLSFVTPVDLTHGARGWVPRGEENASSPQPTDADGLPLTVAYSPDELEGVRVVRIYVLDDPQRVHAVTPLA